MKKLLSIFFIFTITTLPAMAELTRRQLCEDTVTLSEITKWPQEYQDKIKNMLSYPLDEYVNLYYNHDPIVGEGFECSAECSAGEKLADCVKRNEQSEECTKILAAQHIKIKFEPQFQAELCGHIPKNAKSTFDDSLYGSSIEYWQKDKEKNTSSSQAAQAHAKTSTSSDTEPAVKSQSSTSSTKTMTVSGTVFDENNEPLDFANIAIPGTTKGTTTDAYGKFELKDVPSNATLEISFLGYKSQTVNPGTNLTIQMESEAHIMDEVVVTACGSDKPNGIKLKENIDGKCYPSACVEPRWTLSGTGKNAKCVEQKCNIKNGTGEWTADGDTWKCTLATCKNGYNKNETNNTCDEQLKKCTDTQIAEHPNAKKTGLKKGTQTCIATECKCGFKLENEKCVQWAEKEQCTTDTKPALPGNAKSAIMKCDGERAYCEISDCNNGYKVSDDKKSCPSTRGDDCDATAVDKNATAGTNKKVNGKMVCVITDCARGFKPNKDGTKCVAGELSEADSLAKIDELRDNADAMKANEQSTANKLLGAAGMGSTGIGGMQMASAMAEENADADAEAAMRAYLATFHCNYGAGKNIPGGERDVELPGGNELIGLYSEYVNLANDLKIRKTALDMRPGIESEPILDAATSGLYDDVAIGKTSGAYTSLARALMDPNGADAAAWAAQKAETADKKKTGMITAGIGAGGSLVGNLAINSGKEKQEKSAEIIAKYEKLKQVFQTAQTEFDALPAKQCSEFTGTTNQGTVPNCECLDKTNSRFSLENGGCVKCENDKIYNENNECVCPSDKPRLEDGQCKAQIPNCQLTGLVTPNECKCVDNATADENVCKCDTGYNQQGNACAKQDTTPVAQTIQEEIPEQINLGIKSDTLFVSGKADLSQPEGENTLNEFIKEIQKYDLNDGNFCIVITGHTDRVPFKKAANKNNQQLSLERANAIKNILISQAKINVANIKTDENGETDCTPNKYPNANDSKCRRVDITLTTGTCQS